MNFDKIPSELQALPQWVLWRIGARSSGDKPTKLPYQINGSLASANKRETWATFERVQAAYERGGYAGVGFEFSAEDEYCGIDLDGCRAADGTISDWARDVLTSVATYSEVSPSQTGVKLFLRGKSPFATGKKKELDVPAVSDKTPAIEIYDWGRYFAVTGWRLGGLSNVCESRESQLEEVIGKYFPNEPASQGAQAKFDFRSDDAVFERARKYLLKLPPAVSGQDGHGRTFHAACVLVCGFELSETDAMNLMRDYNTSCQPQWSEKELAHKVRCAFKQPGEKGYLRNANPDRWSAIGVPTYQETTAKLKHEPRETTLLDATRAYVDKLRSGESTLLSTGIADLDYAIGGGVEEGEMIVLAARPSHSKSAVGLQCVHHWTNLGIPCAIVSEEMAALALGKRTVQFVSDIPEEHWFSLLPGLEKQVDEYAQTHAKCVVLEGCGTAEVAKEAIERAVKEHGVKCVVVDYAQLLGSGGKDRYQQMSNMSVTLRQLASAHKIVLLALCQMSRAIESRQQFRPELSDLKETGQLEQDADVIIFLCWPNRLDANEPENKYQFFIKKNRNRAINQSLVVCRFAPSRQKITDAPIGSSYSDVPLGRGR